MLLKQSCNHQYVMAMHIKRHISAEITINEHKAVKVLNKK